MSEIPTIGFPQAGDEGGENFPPTGVETGNQQGSTLGFPQAGDQGGENFPRAGLETGNLQSSTQGFPQAGYEEGENFPPAGVETGYQWGSQLELRLKGASTLDSRRLTSIIRF